MTNISRTKQKVETKRNKNQQNKTENSTMQSKICITRQKVEQDGQAIISRKKTESSTKQSNISRTRKKVEQNRQGLVEQK